MTQPLKIFISYARRDADFKEELLVHLTPLKRNNLIELFHDDNIEAGIEWEPEILLNLQTADVILFLVSPNFMASEYIFREEIQRVMERHKRGEIKIVPIWIKPVAVPDEFLNRFQSLPKDRKPVSQWSDQDEAWVDVVKRLNQLFESLNNKGDEVIETPADASSSNTELNSKFGIDKMKVKNLIAKNKTKDALEFLLDYTKNEIEYQNELVVLYSRFYKIEQEDRLGIADIDKTQLWLNKINMSILSILDKM